ncbi:hypothetical protein BASA50_005296 [Batrachochytrium salamandrivorans]|uniref:Ribosomal protein L11 n=1 Tax=Batrachochytrium salamandrivorans TaxID=1357716 RepID=A0ABQ8FGC0_9FUNG|nr:hypothetical protein BASA62_010029 [Batrachochytrium salamandrivorans]KAH6578222.1 hypothetical protein BASA62_000401 [Batrachochytrium salamandrivorans]KAH6596253.1 hypothetical protein BASA50_005296 [Batrachochytrium salamandrivorans]KAH9272128.1 ribosomal protein L11 [Batrachochytrium salamandrivorans]KAJ1330370.1 ribosomal protein L11 [Batrachochytrium salamandrivorans]
MSKKAGAATQSIVRMLVPAGKAAPAPPVGPALGQKGVKAVDFCKLFNDQTKHYIPGIPITTIVTVNPDRTFTFFNKSPPATWLIKQAAGLEKGSAQPRIVEAGQISLKHIYEIAKIKQGDRAFEGVSLEAVCRSIIGTSQGMGITVVH